MPARSTRTTRANWKRFLRHLAQKYGLAEAARVAKMGVDDLARVLNRPGISGRWGGRLATKLRLIGECSDAALHDVFAKSRVVIDRPGVSPPEVYSLRSKFDGAKERSSPLRATAKKAARPPVDAETVTTPTPTPTPAPDPEQSAAVGDQSAFFGLVFGLPKSVSALALFDDPQVLLALEMAVAAYRDAAIATFDNLARCRSGRAGATSEAGEGVIAASWIHRGNGEGEPHWHVHICLSNATWRSGDETGRALDSRMIFAAKRLAEASGLAAMEAVLTERLGLSPDAWVRHAVGSVVVPELAAMAGVAAQLSGSRARLAACEVETRGYGGDATRWRAHRAAAASAAKKAHTLTPEEIEAQVDVAWSGGARAREAQQEAWHSAVDPDVWRKARQSFAMQRDRSVGPVAVPAEIVTAAMDDLLTRIKNPSLFDFAAVGRSLGLSEAEALRRGALHFDMAVRAGVLISDVAASPIAEALLARESIVTKSLHQACGVGGSASIARAAVDADLAIQSRAEALARARGRGFPVGVPPGASDEQILAIQLAAQGRKLGMIVGVAGAGKTRALKAVTDGAKRARMRVISTARNAARATETGEEIGAHWAATLETLLADSRIGVDQPTLIVLDEGAVVDKVHVEALLALAEDPARQVQIVALGDRKQAQAIDGFSAFTSLIFGAERAGGVVRLKTSRRCARWAKEAGEIRAGEGGFVLDRALTDGRLITATTEAEVVKIMAATVVAHRGSVALTSSNAQAAAVARGVQKLLGKTGVFPINYGNRAAVGDRIRTRKNNRDLGIMNGDEWTVERIETDCLVVSGKRGKNIRLPAAYCQAFVELAYAATIDSAQGITAERAIIRVDHSIGRSRLYSAATRGKAPPIYVATGGDAAEILAAAVYRDDIDRTASEVAAEITTQAAPQAETEERQAAEAHLREDLAILRDAVDDIKASNLMTPDLVAAQIRIVEFYRFRREQMCAEASEQERLGALRHQVDRQVSRAVRDRAVAAHLVEQARSRIAAMERDISKRGPFSSPIWVQQQRAQDLAALRGEVTRLAREAEAALRKEKSLKQSLAERISALATAADAVRWQAGRAIEGAEAAITPDLHKIIEAVLKARGQAAEPQAPPSPPEIRNPAVIVAELEVIKAKADQACSQHGKTIDTLKTLLKAGDPAIIATEDHAKAIASRYRLRIASLEQELKAATQTEAPHRSTGFWGAGPKF
ncbi:hypothetical protein ACOSOMT5_P2903 [Acidiphilium sp. MT5]